MTMIDEERQFFVEAFLLVFAVVSTMPDSPDNVDCLSFISILVDLAGLPSWLMVL